MTADQHSEEQAAVETVHDDIQPIELARAIVDLISDKKGEDIVLIDIRGRSILADFFVICCGTSERQIKTLINTISTEVKKQYRIYAQHVEGEVESGWVLIDFADVVVHIFAPETRAYYDLEGFWSEAPILLKIQ